MPLRRLLPLLSCPLCAVTRGNYPLPLLRNPFTLHCGHTVCSSHLETLDPTQRCPLPVCTSAPNQTPTRPNIPSSSRVIYLPPAPPPPSAQQAIATVIDQLGQRVDITVSKLIDVVSRHSPVRSLLSDSDHGGFDLSPGDEQHHQCEQPPPESALPSSDEEPGSRVARGAHRSSGRRRRRAPEPIPHSTASHHSQLTLPSTRSSSVADSVQNPLPSSSGLSDRSSSLPSRPTAGETSDGSDLSPEPPKKRLRRDARTSVTDREASSCATQPEAETNTSDSPSRPVTNRPQLNLLGTEPRRDPGGTGDDSQISGAKELLTELSCEICFAIYYQPVTTPCQHTFCGRCLQRSLDHRSHCPVCRANLPDYVYLHEIPQNKVVLAIESEFFPELYAERGKVIEEEERNARLDTPLFVCQLSFPGVPTNLHFFEPRYRLMLRRCLESPTPRFGIIMPPKTASTSVNMDFGTMLEIRQVKMLHDGRSLVHTWGVSRFRVLERGTLDGYMVGRVEYIDDFPEELEDTLDAALAETAALEAETQTSPSTPPWAISRAPSPSAEAGTSSIPPPTDPPISLPLERHPLNVSNEALMNKCRTFVEHLKDGAAPWIVQKLNESYGNMPADASNFSFWVALVLPIDEQEKAKLLPIRSARLRLKLVSHWIDQLNGTW